MIVIRLTILARSVRETMGASAARLYTGVAALIVESAAPYAAMGIMFLVPYALGRDLSIGFGQVWAKLTVRPPSPSPHASATDTERAGTLVHRPDANHLPCPDAPRVGPGHRLRGHERAQGPDQRGGGHDGDGVREQRLTHGHDQHRAGEQEPGALLLVSQY